MHRTRLASSIDSKALVSPYLCSMSDLVQSILRAAVHASQKLAGNAVDSVPSLHPHPYYPKDLVLPGFAPLQLPFERILTVFFAAAAAITCLAWVLSGDCRKSFGSFSFKYVLKAILSIDAWTDVLQDARKSSARLSASPSHGGR
jgi:hypothetical protein